MSNEDKRTETRSNVFLTAALKVGAKVTTVRLRNLSIQGALVESPDLPPVGTKVALSRGEQRMTGELAWCSGGQAGISFSFDIDVQSWVKKAGHSGQARVDRAIFAIRQAGFAAAESPEGSPPTSLVAISGALDQLCEELAATPAMSLELSEALIRLDTLAQALRQLATGRPA